MSEYLERLQAFIQAHPTKFAHNFGSVSVGMDLMRGMSVSRVVMRELHRRGVLMSNESMKRVLQNTQPDEPVFVLCGRDALAPSIIREWASQAAARGAAHSKTASALVIAEKFEQWQEEHPDLVKVPD